MSYNNNENPTNKLYDHFKTLHSAAAPDPNTLLAFQINVLDDKRRLEDSNHLQSELYNPISIEEIDKAIKKLKNKKAAGLDEIRNEMIKTSSRFIAELSRARSSARSGAPWVTKFGKLSIRENLVMT